jgi:hypothetical protein
MITKNLHLRLGRLEARVIPNWDPLVLVVRFVCAGTLTPGELIVEDTYRASPLLTEVYERVTSDPKGTGMCLTSRPLADSTSLHKSQ